jgi:glycosyltransferase involved in cell wall biosynthesis
MERIRVVQLVAGVAFGDQTGGAEYFGVQLARHLDKREFENVIFAMWQYGSATEKEWLAKLKSEELSVYGLTPISRAPILDLPKILANLWAVTSTFKPHIVTGHSQRSDLLNVFVRLFHPIKPRATRSVQLDRAWLNRPYLDIFFDKMLFPFVFDVEIPSSEATRRRLDTRPTARLLGKKSVLCYSGLESQLFARAARSNNESRLPNRVPDVRPRLGIVGRLTKQKGHADLLQAIKIAQTTRPIHLLVIGAGELESNLREQARTLDIQDRVHFLGSRSDVLGILPHLDLFVSASLWEGFPTVLLEAMAMSVPVVATNVSGSRELVRNGVTGMLVPPGDPARLAEAILAVINDPERARAMANEARQFASQFTIERAAAHYAEIYKQCASVKP